MAKKTMSGAEILEEKEIEELFLDSEIITQENIELQGTIKRLYDELGAITKLLVEVRKSKMEMEEKIGAQKKQLDLLTGEIENLREESLEREERMASGAVLRDAEIWVIVRDTFLHPDLFGKPKSEALTLAAQKLRTSEVFDEEFYKAKYKDITENNMDAAEHYLCFGNREGREALE